MANLKELVRYEMVVNGDRCMLPKPDGKFLKFNDVVAQNFTSTNKQMDAILRRHIEKIIDKVCGSGGLANKKDPVDFIRCLFPDLYSSK